MIILFIYFVIYLIIFLIPYFFLADVAMALFGIEFPQPSMGLWFLSFIFFPIILKLLKIAFKMLSMIFTFLLGFIITILAFPFQKDNSKTSEELEMKEETEVPIKIGNSVSE